MTTKAKGRNKEGQEDPDLARERRLNTSFFFSNFSGAPGISRQNPGISRPKSLISLVSRDISNFLAPNRSRGKTPTPPENIRTQKVWVWVRFSCLISTSSTTRWFKKNGALATELLCTKIAHRRSLAIFAADEGIAGNSAARTFFYPFYSQKKSRFASDFPRRGNRASWGLKKIARLFGER